MKLIHTVAWANATPLLVKYKFAVCRDSILLTPTLAEEHLNCLLLWAIMKRDYVVPGTYALLELVLLIPCGHGFEWSVYPKGLCV